MKLFRYYLNNHKRKTDVSWLNQFVFYAFVNIVYESVMWPTFTDEFVFRIFQRKCNFLTQNNMLFDLI